MKVITSSHAMRFYESEGWTLNKLMSLVYKGRVEPFIYFNDPGEAYWTPAAYTKLDIEALMKIITKVVRVFNDYPELGDKEFLERYN